MTYGFTAGNGTIFLVKIKKYANHTFQVIVMDTTWTWDWVVPSSVVGPATFYVASNFSKWEWQY